jgi:alkylation response protein AidB-like acyl-CoA dehydrogenase
MAGSLGQQFDPNDPLADSAEGAEFRRTVRALVERESPSSRVTEMDEAETFDAHLYSLLAGMGVLGLDAPDWAGGSGDVRDQLIAIEELAVGPTSMAAFLIAQYAVVKVLSSTASTDDQRLLLMDLVAGRKKVSFALSEPASATDVARLMKTRAVRVEGGWLLNGQKMWTSGASLADAIIVLARTSEIRESPISGITAFLVPKEVTGLEVREIRTFGIRGMSTCEVFLRDVVVPGDAVLGEVDKGLRHVFATINREGLNAAAATIGVARGALDLMIEYASSREVFEKPIAAFQVPQHWMVDAAVSIEAARSLMSRAAVIESRGGRSDSLASMAKLVASEAAVEIAMKGMQVMGGTGYTREVPMQRYFRDGRLWSFSPLTNEMVRNRLGEQLLGLPRSY